MIICANCGTKNETKARFCIKCGSRLIPVALQKPRRTGWEMLLAGGLLVGLLVMALGAGVAYHMRRSSLGPAALIKATPRVGEPQTIRGEATPPLASWLTFEDTTCGYSLLYPSSWHIHPLATDAELPPFYLQRCALITTASEAVSIQEIGDNETARIVIWREIRQGQEPLIQWVADRWSWIGAIPDRLVVGNLPGLRLARGPSETGGSIGSVRVWLAGDNYFYALQGFVRKGANYDELVEIITEIQASFIPRRD